MAGRRLRPGGWLLALAVIVCVHNLPRLVFGTVQYDGLEVHYSTQRYLADALYAGHLPFWTPYVFTGFPFLADLQVGAWYPLNWPFFLAGVVLNDRAIALELLLHQLVACGGAYALGLRFLRRPPAAAAVAMFYGLSGWFAAHSQHVGMFDTAAWLPWLLLLLLSLLDRLTPRRLAVAGLVGAAIALPGHFQVALYTFSGVAVWAALESIARGSRRVFVRFAVGLGAAAGWGALLAAVMILPALELVSQSIRTQLDARDVNVGFFHPGSLLTLVYPDYYGLLSGRYVGPGDSTQHYFYAGILLVPLALLGARNRCALRTAAFLTLPFVWYAFGPSAGLFRLVSRLPGFSSVELPMHGWFLPALGLALLGGAGAAFVETRLTRRWVVAGLTFVALDVLIVNQLLNPLAYARGTFSELYGDTLRAFAAEIVSATPPLERLYGPELAQVAYRNHGLQSRVETTYGYNPLELASYAAYAAAADSNPRLVAGFAATHEVRPDGRLERLAPQGLPLAYFAPSVRVVGDETAARAALAELDPAIETVVIGPLEPLEPDATAQVAVTARSEDALVLHYRSRTRNLLRVAIPFFPGWHATAGGSELPLVQADAAFLGVVVPPGEADVQVAYRPRFFALGAIISAVALLGALVALLRPSARATAESPAT